MQLTTLLAFAASASAFVCVPPTYGCGTKLIPKCCHPAANEIQNRAANFVCLPPTFGCGTRLRPKCCDPPADPTTSVVPRTVLCPMTMRVCGNKCCPLEDPITSRDVEERGAEFVCVPPSFGCGTKLIPRCCLPEGTETVKDKRTVICPLSFRPCGDHCCPLETPATS